MDNSQHPLHRDASRRVHSATGAVLVEFIASIFVVLMLLFALVDFGTMMRERATLLEAARFGVRSAAKFQAWETGAFPTSGYWPLDTYNQFFAFPSCYQSVSASLTEAQAVANWRICRNEEAVNQAQNYVARQGLDPHDYAFLVYHDADPTMPIGFGEDPNVQHALIHVVIGRRADRRDSFLIFPGSMIDSCVIARMGDGIDPLDRSYKYDPAAGVPTCWRRL